MKEDITYDLGYYKGGGGGNCLPAIWWPLFHKWCHISVYFNSALSLSTTGKQHCYTFSKTVVPKAPKRNSNLKSTNPIKFNTLSHKDNEILFGDQGTPCSADNCEREKW